MKIRFLSLVIISVLILISCGGDPNSIEVTWQGTWLSENNYDDRGTFIFNLLIGNEEISGTITIPGMGINNSPVVGETEEDYGGALLKRIGFSDIANGIEFESFAYDINGDTEVRGIYSNSSNGDFGQWYCSYSDRSDFSSISSFALDTLIVGPSGLCFDGAHLWVSNFSPAVLYKIDVTNGIIIDSFDMSGIVSFPQGLAWDDSTLWCGGGGSICQLDTSCAVLASFSLPGNCEGAAYGSGYLWCYVQGFNFTHQIYKINPSSGSFEDSIDCPESVEGLAFDGTNLWFSDVGPILVSSWRVIYKMDLTGNILETYNSPCYVPGSLVCDGAFLYCIDSEYKRIFKLGI